MQISLCMDKWFAEKKIFSGIISFAVELYTDLRKAVSPEGVAELLEKIFNIKVSDESIRLWVLTAKAITMACWWNLHKNKRKWLLAMDCLWQDWSSCLAHKQEKENQGCKSSFEESFESGWHKT